MKLSDIKQALTQVDQVNFVLPSGQKVASHFHVTEIGQINKHFIDCGGTLRNESVISFQLFTADDHDHRLSVEKLLKIIKLSEDKLALGNHEVEVEYQGETIGKYGLDFNGTEFFLASKFTDCLAKDNCEIPAQKPKVKLATLGSNSAPSCAPGSGCC